MFVTNLLLYLLFGIWTVLYVSPRPVNFGDGERINHTTIRRTNVR